MPWVCLPFLYITFDSEILDLPTWAVATFVGFVFYAIWVLFALNNFWGNYK